MNNLILRIISSFIIAPVFILFIFLNSYFFYLLLLLLLFVGIYEIKFLIYKNIKYFISLCFILIFFIFSLYELRGYDNQNFYYLLWIFIIIWLSDTGGFVVGKLIGGTKLTKWSPNKTVSGFCGSIFFSQFAFLFIHFQLNIEYSVKFFFIQFFISLITIFGDIFFSYLKRKNNLKDFSNIIPGHGGLLDRIDGMVFAVIFSNFLKFINVL